MTALFCGDLLLAEHTARCPSSCGSCPQPPGAIPNPGGVQTPQQFVVTFREAVKSEPAASALSSWYAAMKLPVPAVFLQSEDDLEKGDEVEGWFFCASPRNQLCGPRDSKPRNTIREGPMPGQAPASKVYA